MGRAYTAATAPIPCRSTRCGNTVATTTNFKYHFPGKGGYYTVNGQLVNPMSQSQGAYYFYTEEAGEHTICYTNQSPSGQIYQACTTVTIDEDCFEPCLLGFEVQESGEPCTYTFTAQVNAAFNTNAVVWSFPALGAMLFGNNIQVAFPANGQYSFYVQAIDTTSCQGSGYVVSLIVTNCTGPLVYGCTDPLASNYDPAANVNDGSCL